MIAGLMWRSSPHKTGETHGWRGCFGGHVPGMAYVAGGPANVGRGLCAKASTPTGWVEGAGRIGLVEVRPVRC